MAKKSYPYLRKLVGTFFVLVLIAIFLNLYFFKYIPAAQIDFHHSSFLELKQFETALEKRNSAYAKAIEGFINGADTSGCMASDSQVDSLEFLLLREKFSFFNYSGTNTKKSTSLVHTCTDSFCLCDINLVNDRLYNKWEIEYGVCNYKKAGASRTGPTKVAGFRKDFDALMLSLVSSYKDIFDDYLIIRDNHLRPDGASSDKKGRPSPTDRDEKPPDPLHDGEIVFNSGNLSVDYLVSTDSLLKKNDGFSLLNVHNVTIEGSSYKLFLYPIKLGGERLILAGLIGIERYNNEYRKIPFNLIVLISVLIVLTLISLPVLKIYIIGKAEEITVWDIRFLTGTYFIGAFVIFFLFANSFLNKLIPINNKKELESLSENVNKSFVSEIDSMCNQLKYFNDSFNVHITIDNDCALASRLLKTGPGHHHDPKNKNSAEGNDDGTDKIDSIFSPTAYPYYKSLSWFDSGGNVIVRWGGTKSFKQAPFVNVSDRQYFSDFLNGQYLTLPDGPGSHFTIQPALSKLDGEYAVTVAIKCSFDGSDTARIRHVLKGYNMGLPFLIGMGSDMHFVSSAIPSPGFQFSIINEDGDVLYDSKNERALLSNIFKVVSNPTDLYQCARYRNKGYFNSVMLRGREVSLLSMPIKGMPYSLLTYYSVYPTEDMHEHLIGLSATVIGILLSILLLSARINEWSKKRHALLQLPGVNFQWLQPERAKNFYYCHLIKWAAILFAIFLAWWFFVEALAPPSEFSLFFITVLFPFYVASHYYSIKQVNNQIAGKPIFHDRRGSSVLWFLLMIVIAVNCYALAYAGILLILPPQVLFIAAICFSVSGFRSRKEHHNRKSPTAQEENNLNFLRQYSGAIVVGIFLICIVPALGIFCLVMKQETNIESSSSQIEMTRRINDRRLFYNQRMTDPSYLLNRQGFEPYFRDLKFQYGIYGVEGNQIETVDSIKLIDKAIQIVSPAYVGIHQRLFPQGSNSGSEDTVWSAGPSSWYYFIDKDTMQNKSDNLFIYQNEQDGKNKDLVGQRQDESTKWSATKLMIKSMQATGTLYCVLYFGGFIIWMLFVFFITISIAKRVFLTGLLAYRKEQNKEDVFARLYEKSDKKNDDKIKNKIWPKERLGGADIRFSLGDINAFEEECLLGGRENDIMETGRLMNDSYQQIWSTLDKQEKFILYDLATDGFTNYKNGSLIFALIRKGILVFDKKSNLLRVVALSFREFILDNQKDKDIEELKTAAKEEDTWKNFKVPLLIVLAFIGLFIFFTQDLIYQKITGLFTSITSIVPLLSSFFGKDSSGQKKNIGDKVPE